MFFLIPNLIVQLYQKAPSCSDDTLKSSTAPREEKHQQPVIVFNGCTFTGCAVALSGPSTYYKGNEEMNVAEILQGITYDDIFDD